ncbi:hypothetical protein [Rufibacter sp. XAAS-G3-1]|uniref:hypothetical protein n=1 Tax=Rufibacter sp. XAAS-G3-1 TaxID=2729134 RepID=UPI0015E66A7E|nr:hypothetical protein [Rufibacter sp. XAAS-G3-1]
MMKSRFLFVLLLGLAFGCARPELLSPEEEEALRQARSKGATLLTVNQPTLLGGLLVNLLAIGDSRCPEDVVCIWYGYAAATFQLTDAQGVSMSQQLYLGNPLPAPNNRGFREADTVVVHLGNKPYRLVLSEVQPYPNFNNPSPTKQKAMLSVQAL